MSEREQSHIGSRRPGGHVHRVTQSSAEFKAYFQELEGLTEEAASYLDVVRHEIGRVFLLNLKLANSHSDWEQAAQITLVRNPQLLNLGIKTTGPKRAVELGLADAWSEKDGLYHFSTSGEATRVLPPSPWHSVQRPRSSFL